jgi:hypothetical protein
MRQSSPKDYHRAGSKRLHPAVEMMDAPGPSAYRLGMDERHSKATIISMAVIASACATLLHEGVGHGVVAWLRGDIPTELTSNHLDALRPDRLVDAGGTLVNLLVGAVALMLSRSAGAGANRRYFFWLLAALNLLPGAGYFLFSGISNFGDWAEVVRGLPHAGLLRIALVVLGAALYVLCVRLLAVAVRPFIRDRPMYNTVGRLPYYAACVFECIAGSLDPLGLQLFFVSTVAAAFGGSSGLMWADSLMPQDAPATVLWVRSSRRWVGAAIVLGLLFIVVLGRGVRLFHG